MVSLLCACFRLHVALLALPNKVRLAGALRPKLATTRRQGCTQSVKQLMTAGRLKFQRPCRTLLGRLVTTLTMREEDGVDSDEGSNIAVVTAQITEVAASIKLVQTKVDDVGNKIESTKAALGKEGLSPDQREILVMDFQSLLDEKIKLLDEKKSLWDEETKLLDKETKLLDEKSLMKKEEILQEAMGAMYLQVHKEWTRDRQTITTAGPDQSVLKRSFYLSQDFESVRTKIGSYVVDKSAFIPALLATSYAVFRRPRRFGKSLFLSMLKYFFYGATGLFKGMAVYNQTIHFNGGFVWCPSDASKHNWPPVPVVHLDFSTLRGCTTTDEFSRSLAGRLADVGKANKCDVDASKSPQDALRDLVIGLANQPMNEHQKVVVLIDEYDAPLNERASDDVSKGILGVYERIFTELKSMDRYIGFVYVTGITSCGMEGIYAGANNFQDLTHSAAFADMCAITEDEFQAAIKMTRPEVPPMSADELAAMNQKQGGYSWDLEQCETDQRRTLFNPFFVAMYCNTGQVDDYWGQTTAASLVARFPAIVRTDFYARASSVIKRSQFKKRFISDNSNFSKDSIARKLLEAGYFTVVDVIDDAPDPDSIIAKFVQPDADVYLGVPNQQIRKSFKSNYLSSLLPPSFHELPAYLAGKAALEKGDMITLFQSLNDLTSIDTMGSIPILHQLTSGSFAYVNAWRVYAFTTLSTMGLGKDLLLCESKAEDLSQGGRSAMMIFVNNVLFVLEFKAVEAKGKSALLQTGARKAIEQIGSRDYLPLKSTFATSRLRHASKVVLVGVVADVTKGERCFAMIATFEVNVSPGSGSGSGRSRASTPGEGREEVTLHQLTRGGREV